LYRKIDPDTLRLVPTERDNSKLVRACLNLAVGLGWLFVAFLRFDRLTEFLAFHPHGGYVFPCVAGSFFLLSGAFGFMDWLHPKPEVKRTALWSRL
jgi:hypothetical protein